MKDPEGYGKGTFKLTSSFTMKRKLILTGGASGKLTDDHDRLRQLILIEVFKECAPENIKVYFYERKVDSV